MAGDMVIEEDKDLQQVHILELEPPHGFLVSQGRETAIARIEPLKASEVVIVSGGEAFGVAELETAPVQLQQKEFDDPEWFAEHRITPRERRQWWPQAERFYLYRLKRWTPFEGIKLYTDGQITDEPHLTRWQRELVFKSKDLPKQVTLLPDAVSVTEDHKFVIHPFIKSDELKRILAATYEIEVKAATSAEEVIPVYQLALIRCPRMRAKKNLIEDGKQMPYEIIEQEDQYCVVKTEMEEGETETEAMGCHETMEEAQAQLAALNIAETETEDEQAGMDKPKKPKPRRKKEWDGKQFDESAWDGAAANWPDTAAYCDDCLIDVNPAGEEKIQALCKLPYRKPDSNEPNKAALRAIVGGRGITAIEKPADTPEETWNGQVRAAANKLIGWWPGAFEQDAPESVYQLAGKTRPKEVKTTFLQRLKQAAANLIDILSMSDEEEDTKLFMSDVGIGQKVVNGELWHFTYSTNAFEDREGEIFSTKALEDYVASNESNPNKGYFNLWHINEEDGNFNTDFARKEWQGVVGRFLVEAGPYLRDERGRAAKLFFSNHAVGHPEIAPEGWGCSPEFRYLPEERATGTYNNIWITRTSTLPRFAAANVWTETRQHKHRSNDTMLTKQQRQAAEAVFGTDFVNNLIKEAEGKTAELEAAGVAHKGEAETATKEEETTPPQAATPTPTIDIDELAAKVGQQFQMDLSPIAEALATMTSGLAEVRARMDRFEAETKTREKNETPRFIFQMKRAAEDQETAVTEGDQLAGKKPQETQPGKGDSWSKIFNR